MSDFTDYCELYMQNEKKILGLLKDIGPLLKAREDMEKNEPALANLRAAEIKIRKVYKAEEAEKEKRKQEKEERKRKAQAALEELGSARKKRGDQDPPRPTTSNLDSKTNTFSQ